MASAEALPSGRWRGIYTDPNKNPKKQRLRGTFDTAEDALFHAQEAEIKAKRLGRVKTGTQSPKLKWGDWWDTLVVDRDASLDSDTLRNDLKIVEAYLRPAWGDTDVNQMPTEVLQDWIDEVALGQHPPPRSKRGRKLAPSYVHRIFSTLSMSMGLLVPKVLEVNPCLGVKLPRKPKRRKPYSTPSRLDLIRPHLRKDYQDAAEFQLETGIRPGELCGLHAKFVELDTGDLVIADAYVAHKKIIRPCPKDEDVRVVGLTDKAIEIARRRLAGRDLTVGCGLLHVDETVCNSPLVFLTDQGQPMTQGAFYAALRRAAKKAKVDHTFVTPYANRRGFATRAADGGANAFDLARWLGHASTDESNEYVQQSAASRRKLQSVLGERVGLVVIEGGRGTERGNTPNSQPLPVAPIEVDHQPVADGSKQAERSNPHLSAPSRSNPTVKRKTAGQ